MSLEKNICFQQCDNNFTMLAMAYWNKDNQHTSQNYIQSNWHLNSESSAALSVIVVPSYTSKPHQKVASLENELVKLSGKYTPALIHLKSRPC